MAEAGKRQLTPQEVQALLVEYQVLEEQVGVVQQELQFNGVAVETMRKTRETIEALKTVEPGQEIILPIGNSASIKAVVPDPSKIMMNVSRDVVIEKDLAGSLKQADDSIDDLKKAQERLSSRLKQISARMQELQPIVQAIYRSLQAQQFRGQAGPGPSAD